MEDRPVISIDPEEISRLFGMMKARSTFSRPMQVALYGGQGSLAEYVSRQQSPPRSCTKMLKDFQHRMAKIIPPQTIEESEEHPYDKRTLESLISLHYLEIDNTPSSSPLSAMLYADRDYFVPPIPMTLFQTMLGLPADQQMFMATALSQVLSTPALVDINGKASMVFTGAGPEVIHYEGGGLRFNPYIDAWHALSDKSSLPPPQCTFGYLAFLWSLRDYRPTSILELGSGSGELLAALGNLYPAAKLEGVEAKRELIEFATNNIRDIDLELLLPHEYSQLTPRTTYTKGNILDPTLQERLGRPYDLIISQLGFHPEQIDPYLTMISRKGIVLVPIKDHDGHVELSVYTLSRPGFHSLATISTSELVPL